MLPRALSKVIESFERLPGIGPKSATRLAFYLLHVPKEDLEQFAAHLTALKAHTLLCSVCKNVAEEDPCQICASPQRNKHIVCVVEQPTDVLSIEKTGKFQGVYHVLHGAIDPLNNIGPDEIYIADLIQRLRATTDGIEEVILAMNSSMEGEATAMYITKQIKINHENTKITRLAHGLPIGADIEYADEVTLARALEGRREY